jgi:hypothetical protein
MNFPEKLALTHAVKYELEYAASSGQRIRLCGVRLMTTQNHDPRACSPRKLEGGAPGQAKWRRTVACNVVIIPQLICPSQLLFTCQIGSILREHGQAVAVA